MGKEQELRLDPQALEAARKAIGTIPGAAYWNDCATIIAAYLAARRSSSDERAEVVGCACQGCGRVYTGDLLVADDVWAKIAPKPVEANKGGGLLCGACIVDRIVEAGLASAVHASPSGVKAGVTEEMVEEVWKRLDGMAYVTIDDVRSILTAALGVGDEGMGEGWQPIATAPKDGTEVLLWGVCWRDGQAYAPDRNVGWWADDGLGWQTRQLGEDIDPTLWRPLPTPPIQGDAK